MELCSLKPDSFKKLLQKAVNAEAKATFWPRFYICNVMAQARNLSRDPESTQRQLILWTSS